VPLPVTVPRGRGWARPKGRGLNLESFVALLVGRRTKGLFRKGLHARAREMAGKGLFSGKRNETGRGTAALRAVVRG